MTAISGRIAVILLSASLVYQYAAADAAWDAVPIPATQKAYPVPSAEYEKWKTEYNAAVTRLLAEAKESPLTPAQYVELWQGLKYRAASGQWRDIAKLLDARRSELDFRKLATDVGSHWLENAEATASLGFGDMKELYRALETLKLDPLGTRIGLRWMSVSDKWRKAPSISEYGTLWNKVFKGSSEEALAARQLIAGHIFQTCLSSESLARSENINMRWCFIQEIYPFLTQQQRLEAVDTLEALCRAPGQIEGLDRQGFAYVRWFMIRMEKEFEFVRTCAAPWINRTQAWKDTPSNEVFWLCERLRGCLDDDARYGCYEALVRLNLQAGGEMPARQYAIDAFEDAADRQAAALSAEDILAVRRMLAAVDLHDKYMADRLDWKWVLLFRQTADSAAGERRRVWNEGLAALGQDAAREMPGAAIPALDALLAAREDRDLPAQQVLNDLLARNEDTARTRPMLQDRLNDLELRRLAAGAADDKVKAAVASGLAAKAAGQRSEAISTLKVLALELPKHPAIARAAGRCMLPLLAAGKPLDTDLLEACLTPLMQPRMPAEPDVWNYACQLLLARVAAAGDQAGRDVWSKGYPPLAPGDRWISDETIAKLPGLANAPGPAGQPPLRLAILTDLLLATTDVPSMCRLQQRRVGALASMGRLPDAMAAGRLAVLLAAGTQEGPRPVALQVAENLKACGASADDVGMFEGQALGLAGPTTRPAAGAAKPAANAAIDAPLAEAAARCLAQAGDALPSRRTAFLRLFAGQPENALSDWCAASPSTQPDRIRWGTDALRDGDPVWAQTLWRCAIISQPGQEGLQRTIGEICRAVAVVDAQRVEAALLAIAKQVSQPSARYQILAGVARLKHDAGEYEECLRVFADGDRVVSEAGEKTPKQLDTELVRVQALIRQKQVDDASKRLGDMQDWPGPRESKAQAAYLLGLIHIQQGERGKATEVLQRLIEQYPQTPFEPKARQLLQRIERS